MGEFATKTGGGDNNYNLRTAADNPQEGKYGELVGSTNLADMLRRYGYVRGSFAINGVEYRHFMATAPGEIVAKINEKNPGVKASLDEDFHLVLESDGNGEPQIADGTGWEKAQEAQAVADRNERAMRDGRTLDADPEQSRKNRPNALECLGLEPNSDWAFGGVAGDWAPGSTAEDRAKAREERQHGGVAAAQPFGSGDAADQHDRALRQGKTGGGTTQLNRGSQNAGDGSAPGQNVQPGSSRNPGTERLPGGG